MDTLCIMWQCRPRGVLITGSCPWSDKEWAAAVGCNMDVTIACIAELLSKGVFEKDATGAVCYMKWVLEDERRKKVRERVMKHRSNTNVTPFNESESESEVRREGESEGEPVREMAEEVYRHYPLKVAKPKAILSIINAISHFGFEFVLDRTVAYAEKVKGTDTLLPHPTTWFNQERFNDDPSTWVKGEIKTNGHAPKPPSLFDLRTVLTAKEKAAQDLKNRHCSEGPLADSWNSQEHKSRYFKLKKEISEINQKIGAFKV